MEGSRSSAGSRRQLSGSAVSALQSKVKQRSHARSKGTDEHRSCPLESDQVRSWRRARADAEEAPQVRASRLEEGSEDPDAVATGGDERLRARTWKPPKGFWREILTQPDSLPSNGEILEAPPGTEETHLTPPGDVGREERRAEGPETPEGPGAGHEDAETGGGKVVKSKILKTRSVTPPPLQTHSGSPSSYQGTARDELDFRTDLSLSPRHEQAKRLLERARLKARSQKLNDQRPPPSPREAKVLPRRQLPPMTPATTQEPPDRDLSEVHHEDQLRHDPPVPQTAAGSGSVWGRLGAAKLQPSLDHVLLKEGFRRCETCGSVLPPTHARDTSAESSPSPSPGQSSHQTNQPALLGGFVLTETAEASGGGGAEDRVSAFGKLRRRSRKGESRAEAGHGPYVRGQELLAQRRNSRTRASLEESVGGLSKQKPVRGVTFAIGHSLPAVACSRSFGTSDGPRLPIKSALKSGSKGKPAVQRSVKGSEGSSQLLEDDQAGTKASEAPQDPFRLSSSAVKSELQGSAMWDADDQADAKSSSEEVCRDSFRDGSHPPERRAVARGPTLVQHEEPRKPEHRKADPPWDERLWLSQRTSEREARPKLSLRRFFSSMGLNSMGKLVKGSRSSSMEQLSMSTPRASPSPVHKGLAPLQRTPSLQALHTESPLAQLRKVSSVQSLQSPKRRHERPALPGDPNTPVNHGSRDLKVMEGAGGSGESAASGAPGRLLQSFPDGSLLLELTRPANTPFGFIISRGKARPDSGIYVEKVVGGATENIYTALLGVGDEILEVNGGVVAGLNLDQVTSLLTRESTATIRILPHRWIQH